MTGRTIIVTGANTGLGFEVARYLCEGGNDVILACRNEEKGNRAVEKIKAKNPNALAAFMQLDLSDTASIHKFTEEFLKLEKKLYSIVCNAGMCAGLKDTRKQYTKQNFELTMGTNHLGHFYLIHLLLDELKKTGGEENGEARIVVVTSQLHDSEAKRRNNLEPLDVTNFFLFNDGTYSGLQAYKNSKLANILFTFELAKRLENSGVAVNCVNPGFIPNTELMRSASGAQKFFARVVLHNMLRFTKTTRTVQQGATSIAALVTDEKLKGVSGKYFQDGQEIEPSTEAKDEDKQKKVWELSGGYLKMDGFTPLDVPEPPPTEEEKERKKDKTAVEQNGEANDKEQEKKEDKDEKADEDKEKGDEKEDKKEVDNKKDDQKPEEIKEKEPEDKAEKIETPLSVVVA